MTSERNNSSDARVDDRPSRTVSLYTIAPKSLTACTECGRDRRCVRLQDGVVLGADTRSTAGTTVADKNCEKIHFIAPNVYCCGAGTAADTENVTGAPPTCWPHNNPVSPASSARLSECRRPRPCARCIEASTSDLSLSARGCGRRVLSALAT